MEETENTPVSNIGKDNLRVICRLCLINHGEIDIFKVKLEELTLYEMILYSFQENISFKEDLPRKICCSCFKHVFNSFVFFKRFKENQIYLQRLYNVLEDSLDDLDQANGINEEIFSNASMFDKMLQKEDFLPSLDRDAISQIFIKDVFSSNEAAKVECSMNEEENDNETESDSWMEQDKGMENDQKFIISIQNETGEKPKGANEIKIEEEDEETSNEHGPFEIITIVTEADANEIEFEEDTESDNLEELVQKVIKSTIKKEQSDLKCFDCTETFRKFKDLQAHTIETGHTLLPRFKCHFCSKTFKVGQDFRAHMKQHCKRFPRCVCDICGSTVLQKNLARHLLSHKGEKSHVCTHCGKGFVQAGSLNLHIKSEHEGQRRTHLCSICGKVYTSKALLTSHLNTHSEEELKDVAYGCKECGKYFVSEESLNIHMQKTHIDSIKSTGPKYQMQNPAKPKKEKKKYVYGPKICHICSKSISYIGFSAHMRMHQGIKPYECSFCSQTFKQQAHLTAHMNIHLGVKPYQCRYCPKTFRHITSRRTHERAHKGEKPFSCPVCFKAFYESSPMKKHLRVHTAEERFMAETIEDVDSNDE